MTRQSGPVQMTGAPGAGGRGYRAGVLRLRGDDGVEVEADLHVAKEAWAGVVVCHPHPDFGGDRHNIVVDRIFHTVAEAGATVVRFDFRSGDGRDRDVVAAVEKVAGGLEPGRPVWLVGYSFGADIALGVGDPRVAGWVAVAPPLRFGATPAPAGGDPRPVLILAAEHDQFTSPDHLREATAGWPDATVTLIESADHFLSGAANRVADAVLGWLRRRS